MESRFPLILRTALYPEGYSPLIAPVGELCDGCNVEVRISGGLAMLGESKHWNLEEDPESAGLLAVWHPVVETKGELKVEDLAAVLPWYDDLSMPLAMPCALPEELEA